jgi:hypothetical protein
MLLATTITLLVFRSPSAIVSVMWLIRARMFIEEKPPFRLRKFHSIANLCATLNAATTFIMFMIYGKKFRSEFTRIYCCSKINRRKTNTIINKEEPQMKQLISNDNEQHNNNQINSSSNQNNQQKTTRGSTGTTTTSVGSLPSLRLLRNQRRKPRYSLDQQCDLINQNKNINHQLEQQQQHELIIREDECTNQNNDTKSGTLTASYSDWFKSLIQC